VAGASYGGQAVDQGQVEGLTILLHGSGVSHEHSVEEPNMAHGDYAGGGTVVQEVGLTVLEACADADNHMS
jgi:hypothetical protein